jgi:maltose alpha-D-glucosyltransferase/alpha-amylase
VQLAETVVAQAQQRFPRLEEPSQAVLRQLIDARERLVAEIRSLAAKPVKASKQRHHGDLVLRKVLLVADDFVITDFAGILTLPLEARRRKYPPLRDVATLLCSLERARAAALDRALTSQPDIRERIEPALNTWLTGAVEALMRGYRGSSEGSSVLPERAADADTLLRLFQLERALRDLSVDLDHRPAAVDAAIATLLSLIGANPRRNDPSSSPA